MIKFAAIALSLGLATGVHVPPETIMPTPASLTKNLNGQGIDRIVTGRRVSKQHRAAWEKRRKAWLDCADCLTQAFPADK